MPGDDFTVSEADDNLALAVVQAASQGEDIPFGRAVCNAAVGTANSPVLDCRLPQNDGGALKYPFLGVSLHEGRNINPLTQEMVHKAGGPVLVRKRGPVAVELEPGISPAITDTVYIRTADSGAKKRGMFTNANISGETVAVGALRWLAGPRGSYGTLNVGAVHVDVA